MIFASPAQARPLPIHFPFLGIRTYVVNTTVDGTGVGACATGGVCSFRQAVNQYNLDTVLPYFPLGSSDRITFSPNPKGGDPIYGIGANGSVTFDNNGISVTVIGNGAGVTNIDGDGSADLQIDGGSVALTNLTVENGNSSNGSHGGVYGGGIANYGGTVTLTNVIVGINSATAGGGIANDGPGTVNINDSTVEDNTAQGDGGAGGGIYNFQGTVNITNSTLQNNSSAMGGGIIAVSGTVNITNSIVESNSATEADGLGGGIFGAGGTFNITNSTVEHNSAVQDGGAIFTDSLVNITNSTVENNTASAGGGIFDEEGTVNVLGTSAVQFNVATKAVETAPGRSGDGGGIYIDDTGTAFVLIAGFSTVNNNTAVGDGGGIFDADSLIVAFSTINDNTAGGHGGGVYVASSAVPTIFADSGATGNSPDQVYNGP